MNDDELTNLIDDLYDRYITDTHAIIDIREHTIDLRNME